ncbi:hypothetical protein ASE43_20895 [Lysobacter sp. Root983]|nr:hypothetical protein ASE43_20895 [Lysobacter sp. Root983]
MVLGDQQHVLLFGRTQQASADQRPLLEVERCHGFGLHLLAYRLLAGLGGQLREVVLGQGKADVFGCEHLLRHAIHGDDSRTQTFLADQHAIERGLQGITIQLPAQAQRRRHVIRAARGCIQLVDEPQALLRQRQRQRLIAADELDAAQGTRAGLAHRLRERVQHRMDEELAQRHFHPQPLAHARDQLHRQQRMAAQLEEVIVATHLIDLQQRLPDIRQRVLDCALRRLVFALHQ